MPNNNVNNRKNNNNNQNNTNTNKKDIPTIPNATATTSVPYATPINTNKNNQTTKPRNLATTIELLNVHLNSINQKLLSESRSEECVSYVNTVFKTPKILDKIDKLYADENHLCDLYDYYQSVYAPPCDGIRGSCEFLTAFQTKTFSGQLGQIAEFAINEELQPDSDSMWKCFQNTFVVPEIHINGQRTYALIDTGASCSAMSLKFSQVEAITSLKLVFRKNTRILKMADNQEISSNGLLENVPISLNNQQTTANTQILNDLSYDLILGRDWCEANGVIIDFTKRKVYFIKPLEKTKSFGLINHLEDKKPKIRFYPTEYAHLTHQVTIKPYHEALISIHSRQHDSSPVFAKSYEPLGERFGIFAIKGIVQFKSNLANIAIGNLSAKAITLPVGTIVAKIESFMEDEYETHEWKSSEDVIGVDKAKTKVNTRRFLVIEELPNKTVHWKPIIKRKQALIVDSNSKLTRLINSHINNIEKCSEPDRGIADDLVHDLEEEFIQDINFPDSPSSNTPKDSDKISKTQKRAFEDVKIDETNLTKDQLNQVHALLARKAQVFAKRHEIPSQASNVTHGIDTQDHTPINCTKYRTSHKERPIISEHIKEMLKNRVIEPSKSPWAFPIVSGPAWLLHSPWSSPNRAAYAYYLKPAHRFYPGQFQPLFCKPCWLKNWFLCAGFHD